MGEAETTRERTVELVVDAAAAGARLDVFLRDHLPGLGRAAVRRLLEDGRALVDGRRAGAGARLAAGQRVIVRGALDAAALPDPSAARALSIVHEDDALVIASKPAGMPSHPLAPGELGTLAGGLLARYPEMAKIGYSAREPGIVHRLDTDTSGLVIAARTEHAFAALRAQLERAAIDKRYLALVRGVPADALLGVAHGAWLTARGPRVHVQLGGDGPGDGLVDGAGVRAGARPIATELVRVIARHGAGALALLEVRARHARRHQVRAHLAALGHPIAGDAPYGGPSVPGLTRHFLHASALSFEHPVTGARVEARAELPDDLRAVLAATP